MVMLMVGIAEWTGEKEIIFPEMAAIAVGLWAVSYTHLDVYKRQLRDGARVFDDSFVGGIAGSAERIKQKTRLHKRMALKSRRCTSKALGRINTLTWLLCIAQERRGFHNSPPVSYTHLPYEI